MNHPLEYFTYRRQILSCGAVSLEEAVSGVGTPAYVYSEQGFLIPLQQLQEGLRREGVSASVCFAVKANPNLSILKKLVEAGAGLDLVSGGELYQAEKTDVPSERIVFSGVGKTSEEMERAILFRNGQGIHSFNVESFEELIELNAVAKRLNKQVSVAFRFNPDVDAKTHPYISTGLKQNKFGMDRKEIFRIIQWLSSLPQIRVTGLSIHLGSQITSLAPLREGFERLIELVPELEGKLSSPLEFLDLGGGLGVSYKIGKSLSEMTLFNYCKLVGRYFGSNSQIVKKRKRPFRIFMEPGRMLLANAGVLLTKIIYIKKHLKKTFVVVDAGMNDLMRPSLYGSKHEIVPMRKHKTNSIMQCDIVGPVCETSDCFLEGVKLPNSLRAGDCLAILSAGAYGHAMSNSYNCRLRPPEILISGDRLKLIRRRETYEDLSRCEFD